MVWTGLEMFVWGGEIGPSQPLTNGALYNPAKNVWRNASAVSQPSMRYGPAGVWSGSEMIVWGGTDGSRDTATGGRICAPLPLSSAEVSPAAMLFGDKHTLSWAGSTAVSSYDLYRGSVTNPWTWNHACIASGFPTPTFPIPDDPGTGLGFYYLVSGRNVDSETSLGSDSTGTPRPNSSPCP
jgi:hypothetical protein